MNNNLPDLHCGSTKKCVETVVMTPWPTQASRYLYRRKARRGAASGLRQTRSAATTTTTKATMLHERPVEGQAISVSGTMGKNVVDAVGAGVGASIGAAVGAAGAEVGAWVLPAAGLGAGVGADVLLAAGDGAGVPAKVVAFGATDVEVTEELFCATGDGEGANEVEVTTEPFRGLEVVPEAGTGAHRGPEPIKPSSAE